MSDDTRDQMLEGIFKDVEAQSSKLPDTEANDPGVGWIAVVDTQRFAPFVEQMGGKAGPLWRMYDIEILPVNDDRTTNHIYQLMTPVHWGSPQRP